MRFALHRANETAIFQMLDAPESLVAEVTPPGVIAIPVGLEVSDVTHVIVHGKPVLKESL